MSSAGRASEGVMVLLEMSIVPLGQGESVSTYVAQCVDLVDRSGLNYELHAMGTIVEGELAEVLGLMQQCIQAVAKSSNRVTCTAKIDYRQGKQGSLQSKIASVEQKLGRAVKK
jgi:uncharacterized protein (TIGR00106 family)